MSHIRYNRFVMAALGWVIWLMTYLLSLTVRCTSVGSDMLDATMAKTAVVTVFWHGEFFILPYLHRGKKVALIVSQSKDGDLSEAVNRHYGFASVRGSSSRGAEAAALGVLDFIKGGYTIAITGDGPRGPRHELKPGPVWFAQKMDVPLIPVTIRFRHCIQLHSWDEFCIPLPFTRAVVIYGEPIFMRGIQRREGIRTIQQRMEQQEQTALALLHDRKRHDIA